MPRHCAVLGRPIQHSLSPALHRAAYALLGLTDWDYERYEVDADQLPAFVAGCGPDWRGLSLTRPLKVAVLSLGVPDRVSVLAQAANTLIFDPDGPRVYNTDVGGLVGALAGAGVPAPQRMTILGAGATARSAVVSASQLGTRHVTVLARRAEQAAALADMATELGLRASVLGWQEQPPPTDLLLSTVTAAAVSDRAAALAACAACVFDAIYDPWPTPLAEAAAAAGRTVLSGLDLLVGQAVLQVELMTGQRVPARLLYDAVEGALRVQD